MRYLTFCEMKLKECKKLGNASNVLKDFFSK